MIPYEYPDIFTGTAVQKELLITDGTVTVTDDEYTVSGETIKFETGDFELESFELSQSLMSEMQFTYGCCETGKVRFIVRKHYVNSIIGVKLKVYIIPNHEASKMLQLGVFKVNEDKQSDNYNVHSITAYDAMYDILNADVTDWYDDILQDEDNTVTLENFRDSFISHFGLDTESASEPLYNDDLVLRRTIEKDQISGAEIIKAICELNGCFGVINNVGEFRYKGLPQNIARDGSTLVLDVPDYIDIQFEDKSFKPIKKVKIVNDGVSATSSQSASGNYNTYTIAYNPLIANYSQADLQSLANDLCDLFYNHSYLPCTINAIGNPVHEVGDCLIVNTKYGFGVLTYIFERTLKGIQALRDTYRSNGVEYLSENLNKQSTQTKAVQSQVSQMAQAYANSDTDFVETIRNIGFRLLDEPDVLEAEYDPITNQVSLKWEDPADISTLEPVPCEWAGTVVVRKEYSAPRHRWDGTIIEDSTTRDEYASTALVDNTIDTDKIYYYGIFPYHIYLDDATNPIKHYRYTKSIRVTTELRPVPYYLINEDTSYVADVMNDYGIVGDTYNKWEFSDYTLQKNGSTGTSVYCENKQLKRKNATRLYVDIEATYGGRDNSLIIVVYSKLPRYSNIRNESSGVVKINKILVNTPNTDYPRNTVEIPLYDLDPNETFHIGFITAAYSSTIVHKVWFDNQIEIVEGFNWSCDGSYLKTGTNTVIARYTQENNRTFIKITDHKSIVVASYPSITGYCGPILLSDDPDGCRYSFQGWSDTVGPRAAMEAEGHIWYISDFGAWCSGNYCSELSGTPRIDLTHFPSLTQDWNQNSGRNAAMDLVEAIVTAANVTYS